MFTVWDFTRQSVNSEVPRTLEVIKGGEVKFKGPLPCALAPQLHMAIADARGCKLAGRGSPFLFTHMLLAGRGQISTTSWWTVWILLPLVMRLM